VVREAVDRLLRLLKAHSRFPKILDRYSLQSRAHAHGHDILLPPPRVGGLY
jgi:hypothetical protein